jgi:hypothetical protein
MKIDWGRKLSSRKFWALLGALAVAALAALGAGPESIQRVEGVVGALGSCAVYMLAEGIADAGSKQESAAIETAAAADDGRERKGDGE